MNLENKIFIHENQTRLSSENLAINSYFVDLVSRGEYNAVVRVYHNKPGVILSHKQGLKDVDYEFCQQNGLEVVARPTGGAAVLVTPEDVMCYTGIFNIQDLSIPKNPNELYRRITSSLRDRLLEMGHSVSTDSKYYPITMHQENIPFAGHAIRFFGDEVFQFDGIVNLRKPQIELIKKAIRLRKLYDFDSKRYIFVDGEHYDLDGARIVRDEEEELRKMIGIEDVRMRKETFIIALFETFNEFCCGGLKYDSPDIKQEDLTQYKDLVKNFGDRYGLGHCFINMGEE